MKKAFVTGATGFVGSSLVRGLIEKGWQVDVITRESSDLKLLPSLNRQLKVTKYGGDIHDLIEIMTQSRPDVVFHVASLFLSDHQPNQVETLINSNVLFGSQLLEAMARTGVHNIVNTSTSWEHYENKGYSPVNLYAATKRAFQDILQYYIEARGVKAITLKLFDTFGSNDPRLKLLSLLLKVAETGETLAMSPGEQQIDLVHIDDVVQAYLAAAQRLLDDKVESYEQYGVGTGKPITLKKLVGILEKQNGKKINIDWGKREYREREVMEPCSCLAPLKDWHANILIEAGVSLMLSRNEN